ncbi:UNVERIFIED_CONTAM: hypothetical protein PYX00_007040 [Menopon gallinae]|uniref:Cytosol aminopeptidase n=1 Tax=Menopon gallinae TaxID=328185 RepID=A0AAW2HI82_9NEOP
MNTVRLAPTKNLFNFRVGQRLYGVRPCKKGLIVGAYTDDEGHFELTKAAARFDQATNGKLCKLLERAEPDFKKGSTRVFYDLTDDYLAVSVVGLGDSKAGINQEEEINEAKENVRLAAAAGGKALEAEGINDIEIESLGDAEAAAEGLILQLWKYEELKDKDKQLGVPEVKFKSTGDQAEEDAWNVGQIKAEAQNLARCLTDTPSNIMTPSVFAENACNLFSKDPKVTVIPRDRKWAEEMKMNSFLGVTKGSEEPPVFLEIHYQGTDPSCSPVLFAGKGITFDTGGISLKPSENMEHMKGDMGGGACVLASIYAASKLGLAVNVIGLIPLCENMPDGRAIKPGDVLTAMNGKTIEVVNTDAEGRLVLADALHYAASFKPQFVLDIATLTGAMRIAVGNGATGVFTNCTNLWQQLHTAGIYTGDRMWRFPLWNLYTKQVTKFRHVDVVNATKTRGGGACTAAAFLKEFAPTKNWVHLDIAGVSGPNDDIPYLSKGMTGRPTRTLIQLLRNLQ